MDLFSANRMRRFMSPFDLQQPDAFGKVDFNFPTSGQQETNTSPRPTPRNGFADVMNQMYNEDSPARTAYKSHLSEMPSYASYNPGKLNRILAGVVGAGTGMFQGPGAGFQAGQTAIRAPFDDKLSDWKNREVALRTAVDDEENSAKNRVAGFKAFSDAARDAAKEEREGRNTDSQIQLRDAQIADYKKRGWQISKDELTGETIAINPGTREIQSFGKTALDPYEKGSLEVDIDKGKKKNSFGFDKAMAGINFGNSSRLADKNNAAAMDRTRYSSDSATGRTKMTVDAADARQDKSIGAQKNLRDTNSNQVYGNRLNDMQEYVSTIGAAKPEVRDFFNFDKTGNPVSVKEPPTKGWTESEAAYKARLNLYNAMVADLFGNQ